MKTALQELIDYFEKQISEYPEDCQKGHIPRDVLNGMHHSNCNALAMAKKLLEKDKLLILDFDKVQKEWIEEANGMTDLEKVKYYLKKIQENENK
jgi:hypothetical protein